MLSLSRAVSEGRLSEFLTQEESRGIGPAEPGAFDALVAEAAKAPQSEDQASRSPLRDGLTEK